MPHSPQPKLRDFGSPRDALARKEHRIALKDWEAIHVKDWSKYIGLQRDKLSEDDKKFSNIPESLSIDNIYSNKINAIPSGLNLSGEKANIKTKTIGTGRGKKKVTLYRNPESDAWGPEGSVEQGALERYLDKAKELGYPVENQKSIFLDAPKVFKGPETDLFNPQEIYKKGTGIQETNIEKALEDKKLKANKEAEKVKKQQDKINKVPGVNIVSKDKITQETVSDVQEEDQPIIEETSIAPKKVSDLRFDPIADEDFENYIPSPLEMEEGIRFWR